MVDIKVGATTTSGLPIVIKKVNNNPYGYGYTVYVGSDGTNCKLSYIHGAGNLVNFSAEDLKQAIEACLNQAKGCVILNTTAPAIFKFIKDNYPVYYEHAVPIGYNNGFQYHVCFKNTLKVNLNCREPNVEKPVFDKASLKQNLYTLLKTKRRKADYVEEFVNSL